MECLGKALGVDMWAVGSGQGELGRPGSCHEGPDYEVVDVAGRGWRTREWCPLGQRGGRPSHGLVGL